MSNADTPAENTGGAAATPTARALADLPNRVRVHALAKLLGSSSREVLGMLADLGETARSPQSSVHRDVALKVAENAGVLTEEGEAGAGDTVAAADSAGEQAAKPTPEESSPDPAPAAQPATAGAATAAKPAAAEEAAAQDTAASAAAAGNAAAGNAAAENAAAENAAAEKTAPKSGAPAAAESTSASKGAAGETGPAAAAHTPLFAAPSPVFLPPEPTVETAPAGGAADEAEPEDTAAQDESAADADTAGERDTSDSSSSDDTGDDQSGDGGRRRRRRGRRGRGRGKGGDENGGDDQQGDIADEAAGQDDTSGGDSSTGESSSDQSAGSDEQADGADGDDTDGESGQSDAGSKRRRRRRRRKGGGSDDADGQSQDDPPNTVVHVRDGKQDKGDKNDKGDKGDKGGDGVRSVRGSTRLEAKRQRRRDGREAGRRRAPILSESEFLARRESVERTMVVREHGESTQIGVLEDGVLVEHFVTSQGSGSIVGNVYLGRVQNVLPSMEAAFIDIGRGRNAVLYAGEVDWDAAGLEGKARKIEQALSSGDQVLVQVTKDPVGHKGARLTTQISLPGRFLVYVPSGGATGISRKLPETERRRLKDILKRIVPEDAGVIIRTASEGISEDELDRDVRRLQAQWEVIKEKSESTSSSSGKKSGAPALLYEEPDLLVKVVRDQFTEDFVKLEVQGQTAWETISSYVEHVAPDLMDRVKRYVGNGNVFADYRIDEQITKALDRKVWLPSGGYLVIDRTEAMTVIDVNTGKFTGSGGNLEETVTRNNLESAEEIVRQLRLRDIGGIIVIDFIDMVLESNRDLVLRRLTECLGRDRTRHQVAEVTSLGLVQMTRKRVGTGLLEAYSSTCEHCKGRGVLVTSEPNGNGGGHQHGNGGGGRKRGRGKGGDQPDQAEKSKQADQGRTPEQRESVVTAVQAVANASKVAKHEDTAETGAAQAGSADEQAAAASSDTAGSAGQETSGKPGKRSRDRKSRRDRGPAKDQVSESAPEGAKTSVAESSVSGDTASGDAASGDAASGDAATGTPVPTAKPGVTEQPEAPAQPEVTEQVGAAAERTAAAEQAESAADVSGAPATSGEDEPVAARTGDDRTGEDSAVEDTAAAPATDAATSEAAASEAATSATATSEAAASGTAASATPASGEAGGGTARRGRRSARRAAGRPTGPAAGASGSGVEVQTVMTGTMSSSASSPAESGTQSNGTSDASVPGTAEQDATSVATVSAVRSSTRRPRRAAGRPAGPPVDDESS